MKSRGKQNKDFFLWCTCTGCDARWNHLPLLMIIDSIQHVCMYVCMYVSLCPQVPIICQTDYIAKLLETNHPIQKQFCAQSIISQRRVQCKISWLRLLQLNDGFQLYNFPKKKINNLHNLFFMAAHYIQLIMKHYPLFNSMIQVRLNDKLIPANQ